MKLLLRAALGVVLLAMIPVMGAAAEKCSGDKIVVGTFDVWSGESPYFYAKKHGVFQKAGLCVELRFVGGGSKTHLVALKNREIDMSTVFTIAPRCAKLGFDCTIVTTLAQHPDMSILKRIDGPTSLVGARVPVGRCKNGVPGGVQGAAFRLYVAENYPGVDFKCDAEKGGQVVHAMAAGRGPSQVQAFVDNNGINFVMTYNNLLAPLIATGRYEIFVHNRDLPKSTSGNGPTVRTDFYLKNPELIKRFIQSLETSIGMMLKDPQVGAFIVDRFKLAKGATRQERAKMEEFLKGTFIESFSVREPLSEAEMQEFFQAYFGNPDYQLPRSIYDEAKAKMMN